MKVRYIKSRVGARHRRFPGMPEFSDKFYASFAESLADAMARFYEALSGAMMQSNLHKRRLQIKEHTFKVGEYATRDGTDVQLVTYANESFADFKCIVAPATGWIDVGEVEHNGQWRYTPLTQEQARELGAMI